ncbi:MAG: hypothetical protein J5643_09165 [Lachnospiraceae bacterium]|nr:hypothetical protein [Lachnospiraceae bacterium]
MESLCPNSGENYVVLDFTNFCEELKRRVEEQVEGCEAELRSIVKNNGTEFRSITIRKAGETVLPTIYLEAFYREYKRGMPLGKVVEELVEVYEKNRNPWPEGLDFSFGGIRDKIGFRVVNYEKNRKMLETMPYLKLDEWAVCFECVVSREGGNVGAVRVDERMQKEWNISTEQLTGLAVKNTFRLIPSKVEPIEDVLAGLLLSEVSGQCEDGEDSEEKARELVDTVLDQKNRKGLPMYVLSNILNHYGATSILNIPFMDKVREKLKEDFYILPSSVHELILIPVSEAPCEEKLLNMVREVNMKEVPEEDFLADGVYRYGTLRSKMTALMGLCG